MIRAAMAGLVLFLGLLNAVVRNATTVPRLRGGHLRLLISRTRRRDFYNRRSP